MMLQPFNRLFGMGEKSDNVSEEEEYHSDEVIQLPISNISPNRFQPRSIFKEDKIKELAQTIHTHGMIQPIVVRKHDEETYEIIAGERRWRAVQSLGWETISDRKSTRLNSSHVAISYAVFCLKKKKIARILTMRT